jgi:nucleotide-binding universal stress UspA family protein
MQNVLVVIPPRKEPERAIQAAIDLAKRRGVRLVTLIVLDPRLAARVANQLTEVGFMGEQIGDQVTDVIEHEYRSDAETLLQRISERAQREGVNVTALLEEGERGEVCARIIRAYEIGTALLVTEKHSWLTRFLSRSAAARLPALAGCEVRLMEEE